MARIRSKNTSPELRVRKAIHGWGYRYRLHASHLPGTPDLVFSARRRVIFVHGCFWHGHACHLGRMPKSRIDFWQKKIGDNQRRDARAVRKLRRAGWGVLIVWECQLKEWPKLVTRIKRFLDPADV